MIQEPLDRRAGGTRPQLIADTHSPSRSVVTGGRLQILLRTALQHSGWVCFLKFFFLRSDRSSEAVVVACGFVTKPQGYVTDSVTPECLYWQWFPAFCNAVTL